MSDDARIRALERMAALLATTVDDMDRRPADPDELGLVVMLTSALDRHLTDLADAGYATEDDVHVRAIESVVDVGRSRAVEWPPDDGGAPDVTADAGPLPTPADARRRGTPG